VIALVGLPVVAAVCLGMIIRAFVDYEGDYWWLWVLVLALVYTFLDGRYDRPKGALHPAGSPRLGAMPLLDRGSLTVVTRVKKT
jgi:hypothetical protein